MRRKLIYKDSEPIVLLILVAHSATRFLDSEGAYETFETSHKESQITSQGVKRFHNTTMDHTDIERLKPVNLVHLFSNSNIKQSLAREICEPECTMFQSRFTHTCRRKAQSVASFLCRPSTPSLARVEASCNAPSRQSPACPKHRQAVGLEQERRLCF